MIKEFNLNNKVAIITGGAGMLGKMHSKAICEKGGIPILLDTKKDLINRAIASLSNQNVNSYGYVCNINDIQNVQDVSKKIQTKFGKVDILINNAALTAKGMSSKAKDFFLPVEEYRLDIWKELINVNLNGHYICTKVFGETMIKKGGGSIINISSEIGLISPDKRIYINVVNPYSKDEPLNNPPGYSVTKAGLIALGKSFSLMWKDYNVRVNTLCPAGVFDNHDPVFLKNYTNLVPMGRMANKDEYMGSIIFLASDASYPITGSTLVVDGGKTCW